MQSVFKEEILLKAYSAKDIRNIVLAGHGGRGKTTLAEAMLYISGATERLGRVTDGNTVMDFDAEEKRRKCSIASAIASFEWKNTKINIIDTPGLFDFAGGVSEGMRAAGAVLIVLASGSTLDVGAEKAFKAARKRGYMTIGWSIRSLDTIGSRSRQDVCDKVIDKLHPGAIILLHDRCDEAGTLLKGIIAAGKERGYSFVSLEELLKIDAYED